MPGAMAAGVRGLTECVWQLGQPFKFVKDAPLKPQLVHRLQVRYEFASLYLPLLLRLLSLCCRWWYVIEWPDEAAIGEVQCPHAQLCLVALLTCPACCAQAPPGYIMLPGFKGVFVGVEVRLRHRAAPMTAVHRHLVTSGARQGEFLGEILDRRDDATKPSYRNLMRKPADELQALLIQVCPACRSGRAVALTMFARARRPFKSSARSWCSWRRYACVLCNAHRGVLMAGACRLKTVMSCGLWMPSCRRWSGCQLKMWRGRPRRYD